MLITYRAIHFGAQRAKDKKRMARKDAKAQRNKGLTQEDVKPGLRKNPFASLRLCAKKNKCLDEEMIKLPFTP